MVNYYIPENIESRLFDKSIPKNGCGSGWNAWLVPDTLFGLDFTIPCAIHDEMYAVGKTIEDKDEADRVFFNNMMREVNSKSCFKRWYGRKIAKRYYDTVRDYGAVAYWDGKNTEKEIYSAVVIAGKIVKGLL